MQLFSMIETTFRRWAVYNEVRSELAAYSERELADLGIRRSEITGIAREAAARIRPATEKHSESFGEIARVN